MKSEKYYFKIDLQDSKNKIIPWRFCILTYQYFSQVFLANIYKTENIHTESHYQTPHLRHLNICDCANKKNTHRMSKKVLSNLQIRLLGRIAWEWSKAVAGYVLKVLLSLFCYYYHILHHFESASFIWYLSHILEIPDSHDCLQVDDGHWGADSCCFVSFDN